VKVKWRDRPRQQDLLSKYDDDESRGEEELLVSMSVGCETVAHGGHEVVPLQGPRQDIEEIHARLVRRCFDCNLRC
jgi:hypothetical protein